MQATTINKDNLLQRITNLTVINQLVETIWVDDSVGKVEVSKVIKVNESIKHVNKILDYKLKSHRLLVKSNSDFLSNIIISDIPNKRTIIKNRPVCESLSVDINRVFISELKSFKNIETSSYKYFHQSIFKRIFRPNKDSDLVDNILNFGSNCSWVVVPEFIFEIIKDSEWFDPTNTFTESLIHNAGTIHNLSVFVNPTEDESILYFGNYDSVTIIINKNIKIEDLKNMSNIYQTGSALIVDYIFLENGITKALRVT